VPWGSVAGKRYSLRIASPLLAPRFWGCQCTQVGARGLCALSISPRNKLSLVQYGAHSGLVAIICSTFAQHCSTCLSAATVRSFDDQSSSALPTQAARLERRRQRQVYEVMRLALKALLGISDVVEVQTYICVRALEPLMQLVGNDTFANELRVVRTSLKLIPLV
jgi:hypothetical protein